MTDLPTWITVFYLLSVLATGCLGKTQGHGLLKAQEVMKSQITGATNQTKNQLFLSGELFSRNSCWKKIFISEDLSTIPSLQDEGTRLKSETAFTNNLSDSLDLSVKYIVDYNSKPASGKKKTDTRFITALTYSF